MIIFDTTIVLQTESNVCIHLINTILFLVSFCGRCRRFCVVSKVCTDKSEWLPTWIGLQCIVPRIHSVHSRCIVDVLYSSIYGISHPDSDCFLPFSKFYYYFSLRFSRYVENSPQPCTHTHTCDGNRQPLLFL